MATVFIEDFNLYFDCTGIGVNGIRNPGVIDIELGMAGEWLDKTFADTEIIEVVITADLDDHFGLTLGDGEVIDVTIIPVFADALFVLEDAKTNWVSWSRIGSLDFDIERSNEAGTRPMMWTGAVHEIKMLNNLVVVYGENGVSEMAPRDVHWGLKELSGIGIAGKNAVAGTDKVHWFVDKLGQLWQYADALMRLDYREYLSGLTNPVLSWDESERLLYICDGTDGYVYSPDSHSLGKGPENVTGIRYRDDTTYIVGPANIEIPLFSLTTDIFDLGSRKEKTIFNMEFGTDVDAVLQAAVSYRVSHKDVFQQTPWVPVTQRGFAYVPCYGIEFKFHLRATSLKYLELDYMKINGVISGYSFLDVSHGGR